MDKDIIQILWSALLIVIVTIVPLVKKFKEMQRKELRSASAAQPVRQAEADTSAPEKRPASPQKLKKRNLRYATRSAYPERTPNSNLIAPVSPKNSTCEKRSFIRR